MGMSITVHSDTNLKYKNLTVKITADGVKFGIRSIINSASPHPPHIYAALKINTVFERRRFISSASTSKLFDSSFFESLL